MKTFYAVIGNTLFSTITNFFVWFALVFWLYLSTQSVLATSIIGGLFMVVMAVSGFWLGSIVDHNRKKTAMIASSVATLFFFTVSAVVYALSPETAFVSIESPLLWCVVLAALAGVTAGNIRGITLPTLVTILVPEDRRDKANGVTGIVMGISSFGSGIASGFALAHLGMLWVLIIGIVFTILSIIHLVFIKIPEPKIVHVQQGEPKGKVDIKGTVKAIKSVPGLFPLIFFTTFNNFLGGAFIALMDPYGLSLMPVQIWSLVWGFLSTGFIVSGIFIARRGLGKKPLRNLFIINGITWTTCILFTAQPSIALLVSGILVWVLMMPFIEATEQTIIQKVVPLERQGRVFGFAQSIETAAAPLTAFIVGPLAQFVFIPFMTTGKGVDLIGSWFGTGPGRGMALIFIMAGTVGLIVTIIASCSRAYKLLAKRYQE